MALGHRLSDMDVRAVGDPPEAPRSVRAEILREAETAVMVDRSGTHGDMADNFARIAGIWSIHLGVPVTAAQVALMMIELKTVRAWGNPGHRDNWVDIAGYAACGGEVT